MPNPSRTMILAGAFALAILAAFGIYRFWTSRTVEVVHPSTGTAVDAVYATGTVEPTIMMPIAPRVAARLMTLDVDEGEFVHKGQEMARLEDEDLASTLAALVAEEKFARTNYMRNESLSRQGAIARATLDRSKSDWDAARANVNRAQTESGFMHLLAPNDGYVIRRDGEIGQFIPVNQPIFWISCAGPLRISAEVDEEDVPRVRVGQEVLIRADALPGRVIKGVVHEITPKGDPVARSYRVRVTLPRDTPLMIGMTTETNIIVHRSLHAMLLPTSALQGSQVWRVVSGRLEKVTVVMGAHGPDETEILRGISSSDEIVRNPDATLIPGERVSARLAR